MFWAMGGTDKLGLSVFLLDTGTRRGDGISADRHCVYPINRFLFFPDGAPKKPAFWGVYPEGWLNMPSVEPASLRAAYPGGAAISFIVTEPHKDSLSTHTV
jgi:hypothetical protein